MLNSRETPQDWRGTAGETKAHVLVLLKALFFHAF